MTRFALAATVLVALAAAACSSSREPEFGTTVAAAPNDPVVSFADRECRSGTSTGHGMGYQRCMQHMDQVAQARGGDAYVAALRSD
jgi:hypothetical protein